MNRYEKIATVIWAIVIGMIIVFAVSGCSYVSTEFVDTDGTNYKTTLWLAPFSKLDGKTASMVYDWTAETGGVKVGEGIEGLDQTNQVEVMQAAIAAAVAAALKGATP